MKISILHATRRPEAANRAALKWLVYCSMLTPVEYILSIDTNDTGNYDYSETFEYPDFKIIRNDNRSAVDAFNRAAEAATGDLFVCISDDMDCEFKWDVKLLETVKDKENFLLKTDDGLQPTLVTLPIMDRKYYESFGYVYQPDYAHMFVDQELTAVAIMTGRYLKCNLKFPHAHYTTDRSKYDEINRRNDSTWAQGQMLFEDRLLNNFGIAEPVVPYESIQWK